MKAKIFACRHCGNIAALIRDKGVPLFCCGEKMRELIPNTANAAEEKHVPICTRDKNTVHVTVGEVTHPMTDEHYIEWVLLETEKGLQIAHLTPKNEPKAVFALSEGDSVKAAYAYCNQHDFWRN